MFVLFLLQVEGERVKMKDTYSNETHNTSLVNGSVAPAPGFPVYLHQPLGATVFQITLWSIVVFLGVIGNLLVCAVILGRPKMKTSMNYYLLSLAVADLGVLIMIYPVAVLKHLSPFRWVLGKFTCLYVVPTQEIFFGASIWSITVIAIERYRNICGANRYNIRHRSQIRTKLAIIGVWLASFLVASVPVYPIMTYKPTIQFCYAKWPDASGRNAMYLCYSIALIVVWYVLPLAVIAFTYIKIKRRILESVLFRNTMSVNDEENGVTFSPSSQNTKRRVKKMLNQSNKTRRILTPLVILFAVTMFPLNALRILLLVVPGFPSKAYYNLIFGQVILFLVVNSSVNPLVYYIASKEFKDAFKKIFQILREKKNLFRASSFKSRATSNTLIRVDNGQEKSGLPIKSLDRNNSRVELINENVQIVSGL